MNSINTNSSEIDFVIKKYEDMAEGKDTTKVKGEIYNDYSRYKPRTLEQIERLVFYAFKDCGTLTTFSLKKNDIVTLLGSVLRFKSYFLNKKKYNKDKLKNILLNNYSDDTIFTVKCKRRTLPFYKGDYKYFASYECRWWVRNIKIENIYITAV